MNVNKVLTKDYENISNWKLGENKPNTNPIQTESNPTCRGVASGEAGSNPIYGEQSRTTCSELACGEQGRTVEPISNFLLGMSYGENHVL